MRCETPHCGAEIPLVRSFWLSKKANRGRAFQPRVVRPKGELPRVELEIVKPKGEKEVSVGTVSRAKATCLCCNTVLGPDRVRAQLTAQRGGAEVVFDAKGKRSGGARLLGVVTLIEGQSGRNFRLPTDADYRAVWKAQQRLKVIEKAKLTDGLTPIPDEPLPPVGTLGFRVQRYGMTRWGDLFTARQKVALSVYSSDLNHRYRSGNHLLPLLISRMANGSSSLCRSILTQAALPRRSKAQKMRL